MYRKKVVGIIFDDNREYLIVQLVDYGRDEWNFPGLKKLVDRLSAGLYITY